MATLTSKLIVALVDNVSRPSRGVSDALTRLNAVQERNSARLDAVRGRMLEAGAVAYALAKAVSAPIRAATEFETVLEDIGQKLDLPQSKFDELGASIRKLARDTTQTASEVAKGVDVLAGMGANEEDSLALMPTIGKAATAYRAEVEHLAQAGYAALDNLKVPANEFSKALDTMAQAGKAGAFELRDMAQYFPTLGAAYQGLGQTGVPAVADLSAALQIVRKGTGDASSAATNLSNILQKIYAPRTIKAFDGVGVDLRKEMEKAGKAGLTPIEAIAEITNRTLKGDMSKLGDLFADAQVQQGLRPLIQNIGLYRQIRAEAMAAQGVVEEDYKRRLQTGAIATQRWTIAIESLNLAIGNALLPALTSLANDIIPIITAMAEWADRHPALTRAIVATTAGLIGLRVAAIAAQFSLLWMKGGVITAAIMGLRGLSGAGKIASVALLPVTAGFRALRTAMIGYTSVAAIGGHGVALAAMGQSLLGLLNPLRLVSAAFRLMKVALISTGIGAIVVGIAMAGTWIYNNWTGIGVAFEAFKGAFMRAIAPVMPALQPVITGFTWLWDTIAGLLGPIDEMNGGWAAAGIAAGKFVGETLTYIIELPGKIIAAAASFADAGMRIIQSLWDGMAQKLSELVQWVKGIPGRIGSAIGNIDLSSFITMPSWLGGATAAPGAPAIAGARAAGGPVRAGSSYLVGERGPELVTFPQSGFVHDALKTARLIRNAALASASVAVPSVAAPTVSALQPAGMSASASRGGDIHVGGIRISIQAAAGQSPEAIAQAVGRELSAKLSSLSNGAFSDGGD